MDFVQSPPRIYMLDTDIYSQGASRPPPWGEVPLVVIWGEIWAFQVWHITHFTKQPWEGRGRVERGEAAEEGRAKAWG